MKEKPLHVCGSRLIAADDHQESRSGGAVKSIRAEPREPRRWSHDESFLEFYSTVFFRF